MDYCNLKVIILPIKVLRSYNIKMTEKPSYHLLIIYIRDYFTASQMKFAFTLKGTQYTLTHIPMEYLNNPSISHTLLTMPSLHLIVPRHSGASLVDDVLYCTDSFNTLLRTYRHSQKGLQRGNEQLPYTKYKTLPLKLNS